MANYIKIAARRFSDYLLFGNVTRSGISEYTFRTQYLDSPEFSPVFFLSTGRTGTALFTKLLERSKKLSVFHSPSALLCHSASELIEQGRVAYERYHVAGQDDETVNQLTAQIFLAAREALLYKSFVHGKRYVETNNRVSFLAPAIKKLIPHAKFVHLYRHPAEFVRSGVRRNYYQEESLHGLGRLTPLPGMPEAERWSTFSQVEKIAWLWQETNGFIERFFNAQQGQGCLQFDFNRLNVENVKELLAFLEITDIGDDAISELIGTPVNAQMTGDFPMFSGWSEQDKASVRNICGELAQRYGYDLDG